MQVRDTLRLLLIAAMLACLPAAPSEAQIIGLSEHEIDLTKAKAALERVRWDDTDLFRLSEKGLGRISNPAGTREVTLRTTQPIALGTWWRPTDNASIQATITWAGEHAGAMPGDLYVSYSCGAASWSDWQLVPQTRASKTKTTRVHNTVLQIPRNKRKWYWKQLREYGKQDGIAWDSDEEAFVTWHRERYPTAFTKMRPFIGYLRFKYETEVPHGTYLTGMSFDTTWVVSGISSVPSKAVEAIQEKRRDQPWSWRGDSRHENAEAAAAREATEKAVFESALRYLMADAVAKRHGDKSPYERLVLRPYTASATSLFTLPRGARKDFWTLFRGVKRGLARDFQERSAEVQPLPRDLNVGAEVIFVSPSRWRGMSDEQGTHDWSRHQRTWPRSFGRITCSGVGLNGTQTEALVHIGRLHGYLAGYGTLIRLEKRDGTWVVVEATITWIS